MIDARSKYPQFFNRTKLAKGAQARGRSPIWVKLSLLAGAMVLTVQVLAAIKGAASGPTFDANPPPKAEAAKVAVVSAPSAPVPVIDPKRLKACIQAINTLGDSQTICRDEATQAAAFQRIRELKTPEEQQADDDRAYRNATKAVDAVHAMGEISGN